VLSALSFGKSSCRFASSVALRCVAFINICICIRYVRMLRHEVSFTTADLPSSIIHHHPTSQLPPPAVCPAAIVALFLTVRCVRTARACAVHTRTTHLPYERRPRCESHGLGTCHCSPCLRDPSGPTRITLTTRGTTLMDSTRPTPQLLLGMSFGTVLRPPTSDTGYGLDGNKMPRESRDWSKCLEVECFFPHILILCFVGGVHF